MSRPPFRGRLKANAVVLLRLISSPSTRKDVFRPSCDEPAFSNYHRHPRQRTPLLHGSRRRTHPPAAHCGPCWRNNSFGFPVGGQASGMGQSLLSSFQLGKSDFEGLLPKPRTHGFVAAIPESSKSLQTTLTLPNYTMINFRN